ncbi:MAG: 2-amino-4-hydroxy-6-hydroxymethyldihydropteridine diphosphokinase, partial [Gammaproteobacteria bacterium]
ECGAPQQWSVQTVYHVFIGIGSNLGRQQAHILRALDALTRTPQIRLIALSPWYRNPPIGLKHQGHHINGVIEIHTPLTPLALLHTLKRIERQIGRTQKRKRWGPRVIDLDILLYETRTLRTRALHLPHAQIWKRAFTVLPLLDLYERLPAPTQQRLLHAAQHFTRDAFQRIAFPDPRRRSWRHGVPLHTPARHQHAE